MNYPVVIHKDSSSDYGVTVPDLEGCFSAGSTMDEALAMAQEAIELHLEGLIEDGQPVSEPRTIEEHQGNPDFDGGTWGLVHIDPANLRIKAKRINITMPQRVLDAVDRFAASNHETRSGLLVKAATDYIWRRKAGTKTSSRRKPGRSRQ